MKTRSLSYFILVLIALICAPIHAAQHFVETDTLLQPDFILSDFEGSGNYESAPIRLVGGVSPVPAPIPYGDNHSLFEESDIEIARIDPSVFEEEDQEEPIEVEIPYILEEGENYPVPIPHYGTYESSELPVYCRSACASREHDGLLVPSAKRRGQFYWDGWLSAGAVIDTSHSGASMSVVDRFPDRMNEFIMNQLYFTFGRSVNKNRCAFDLGGRVDFLYGTDYFYTTALGLETKTTPFYAAEGHIMNPRNAEQRWNGHGIRNNGEASLYGLSMPQLYAELFAPIGLGTTIKLGHFYSMMGFESAMSTENFFYTRSYTTVYGEPTTFTGMVVSQQLTRRLTGIIGFTQGWNIWENPNDKLSVIAGGKWVSDSKNTEIAFTIHSGKYDEFGQDTRTNYSLVISQQLSCRLKWVIQHDLGREENANFRTYWDDINNTASTERVNGRWASITNYLFYRINEKWSLGGRFEWFQDSGHSKIATMPLHSEGPGGRWLGVHGRNYYNFTIGANWKPTPYFTLRPEIRWDWSDVKIMPHRPEGLYNGFSRDNLCTIAIEGVLKF